MTDIPRIIDMSKGLTSLALDEGETVNPLQPPQPDLLVIIVAALLLLLVAGSFVLSSCPPPHTKLVPVPDPAFQHKGEF